uniref:EPIDERMAL PATTERNING FACTOR-like protein 1 n=1 Tax=Erigeron canadensis TaxID=72917 RepID=UPI001CB96449|nr:EPIDERMAL PATTERNING FACTOR-like protein 1 [Erigeron canadensis]
MDRRMWNFMILLWHIMMMLSWVCARNMHHHLATSQGLLDQGNELKSPRVPFFKQKEGIGGKEADEEVLSRLGSRPPRCEHRCRGCAPCVPIQVPTAGGHVVTPKSYTNYEPEGWKCKCGSILFNP